MENKFVIIVQAGPEELAKALHALLYAQELHEADYKVQMVFDGAGTTWLKEFEKADHHYHPVFKQVQKLGVIAEACEYCANAFGVTEEIKNSETPLTGESSGHPSLVKYIKDGYTPIVM